MKFNQSLTSLFAALLVLCATSASARDYVDVVGSSTVFHFSTIVAEALGRSGHKTPVVESIGSGGGIKRFCDGLGLAYPDIANASRRIQPHERDRCAKNQVNDIAEIQIGYDGIALVHAKSEQQLQLSLNDLYLALAKYVPALDGSETTVTNPYSHWQQINPQLPNTEISVYGPPSGSGTLDGLVDLVMAQQCQQYEWLAVLASVNPVRFDDLCRQLRDDGRYKAVGENDSLTVQYLSQSPQALGVLGYSVYSQNQHLLKAATVEGFSPDFSSIASGRYPIARPLYFYLKQAHLSLVPGLFEYVDLFASDVMIGPNGYLSSQGMVPLEAQKRAKQRQRLQTLGANQLPELGYVD